MGADNTLVDDMLVDGTDRRHCYLVITLPYMLVDGTDRRHDNLVKVSKREEGNANHTHSHILDCRTSQMHILTRTHTPMSMHIGSRPGGKNTDP